MSTQLPKHATLPVWKDKTAEQKEEYLNQLWADLYVYADQNGYDLRSVNTPGFSSDQDRAYQEIQELYGKVLRAETSALQAILQTYQPLDEHETENLHQIKKLVHNHPTIFNMSCEIGHLTGSGLIVDIHTGQILLHQHKKIKKLLQVGGHADYETEMLKVALRESQEETGLKDLFVIETESSTEHPIDIDLHTILERDGRPTHLHLDFRYLLGTKSPGSIVVESIQESADFKWLEFDQALALSDQLNDSLIRLIKKAKIRFLEYAILNSDQIK